MASKPDKQAKSGSLKPRPSGQPLVVDQSLLDQFKGYLPGGGESGQQNRRKSRKEREDQRTKWLYYVVGAAAALVILLLGWGALNDYYLKPNKVLASVNNVDIKREDYWKVRSHNLLVQSSQYQQIASFSTGDQQTQYLTLAQQSLAELEDVWGSTETDAATLELMINDQVYLQGLADDGSPVSQTDIEQYIALQFQPAESPLVTPSPTPTLIPERAAWATETAVALGTPIPVDGSPEVSVEASPAGSPVAADESSLLSETDALATTEASYEAYGDQVFGEAHMSRSDYEKWIVAPAVARQRVQDLSAQASGQSADQVNASHILVATEELARDLHSQLLGGADFAELARVESIDTATGPSGGELGWFIRGAMVPEFEEVAFATAPGEFSEPFQTQFGWHILKVHDLQLNRAMTDEQIEQAQQVWITNWETTHRDALDISSDLPPTPTPFPEQFAPPPGAPTPPLEVPVEVTPVSSSSTSPSAATPVAD